MVKKRLKKLFASTLALSMAVSLMPAAVMANADAEIVNEPIALEEGADNLVENDSETQLINDVWAGKSGFKAEEFDGGVNDPNNTALSYNANQAQIKQIVVDPKSNTATIYANLDKMKEYYSSGAQATAKWCTIGLSLVEGVTSTGVLTPDVDRFVPTTAKEGTKVLKWVGARERDINWTVSHGDAAKPVVLTMKTPTVDVNSHSESIAQGDTVSLNFTTDPANPVGGLSIQSSAPNVATVTSDGTVTGVAPGVATITAKMYGEDNLVATCEVTVAEKSSTGGDAIVTPEPTTTVDPSVTPDPSETPDASVTPDPSETPDASVTPEPTGTPGTITPEPTNTPEPTPTEPVKKGDEVETKAGTVVVTNTKTNTVAFDTVDDAATTVTIPKTVKIDGVAYTVTTIKASAFADSKKLTNVTIPATITAIGKNAFAGCSKLTKVTVKSTKLKAIKANTFKDCKALTSISLPKSVTSIGKNVFSGCSKLKTITIKATTLKVKKGAFKGIAKNAVIKVPKSKVKAFSKILKKAGFKGKVKAI